MAKELAEERGEEVIVAEEAATEATQEASALRKTVTSLEAKNRALEQALRAAASKVGGSEYTSGGGGEDESDGAGLMLAVAVSRARELIARSSQPGPKIIALERC